MAIVATMWKLSCLLLLFITVVHCATRDTADIALTEGSRNDRDHENRKHRSEVKDVDYVDEERPYEDDYTKPDSEEFRGGKLIGKWRNNGAAFEPKWRDGDSVPLVPFNAAKQTKVGRHDAVEGFKYRDSSHAVTKPFARDASVGRTPDREASVEDASPASEDYPANDGTKDDRYTLEKDYSSRYRDEYDDSRSSEFSSKPKKMRTATILTDNLRYDTTERAAISSGKSSDDDEEKIGSILSRSRYRDTFQVHPNEYELNDEEYQKPRPRKRRPPQNYEFSEIRAPTYSITWSTERYIESTPTPDRPRWSKDPDQTRKRPEKPAVRRDRNRPVAVSETQRVSENAELKSLLKMQQTEGLSLSELLQRRNLTLNDLLKGKAEVINVLKKSESHEEDATEFSQVKPKIFETKTMIFATTERPKWRPSQTRNKSADSGNEVSSPKSENDVPASDAAKTTEEEEEEDEESLEHLDSAETEDGQRKSNDNEKLSAIVRLTKPIILPRLNTFTEKSIIVTTTGRVAKDFVEVYQNDESVVKSDKSTTAFDDDEIMEFSDFTGKKNVEITTNLSPDISTSKNGDSRLDDTYEDSGSTLSIEHILSMTDPTILPTTTPEPNKFDNKDNSVVMEAAHNDTDMFDLDSDYQSDEPQEFSEERSEEELPMGDEPYVNREDGNVDGSSRNEETWKNHQIFSTSSKPYEVVISEIEPEARAEIFELFSSGSSAKRLERLLKSRNMSIDELIALRQRGSSKVHMAEVLRSRETLASRSQSQRTNDEAAKFENRENGRTTEENLPATTMDDLSDIEIKSTTMTTTTEIPASSNAEEQTNIASMRTEQTFSDLTTEQTNVYSVRTERTESSTTAERLGKHVQLLELLTAFDSLPFSVRPDLDREMKPEETKIPRETEDRRVPDDFVEKIMRPDLPTSLVEVGLVEEIAREDSIPFEDTSATSVTTNYSSTHGEERKNLSKVRPSIIASGAILGVTIVVFLAIFIVCRIRQKQKYTYRNTFSRGVFQGPAMTARKLSNSSSLNTIMVNVVATSTNKRPEKNEQQAIDDEFDFKSDIENDSLDANDSWDTIPDFMK